MPGYLFAFFKTDDRVAAALAESLLSEGRTYQVDKRWSVRADRSHAPNMDGHLHVQFRGRDVAVINRDGSPSHNSDPTKIPNWVLDWMKNQGLSESYLPTAKTLGEAVPAEVIKEAIRHEELIDATNEYISRTSPERSPPR